jgi:hypothetical protein
VAEKDFEGAGVHKDECFAERMKDKKMTPPFMARHFGCQA